MRLPWCVVLEDHCREVLSAQRIEAVKVDINGAVNLDSTTLGVLAKVGMLVKQELGVLPVLYCIDEDLLRLVLSMSLDTVFEIENSLLRDLPHCDTVRFVDSEEDLVKGAVIDAHRTLMDIDERNVEKFEGLVNTLEGEAKPDSGLKN